MYNRYIPQPDGSHRRRRMEEPKQPQPPRKEPPCSQPPPVIPMPETCPPPACQDESCKEAVGCKAAPKPMGIGSFFRQLLPKELDTGDIMILLLLLLMAGDCEENRNTALLTLALYFLM